MPWDYILGAGTGSAAVVVLVILFARRILDTIADNVGKRLDSTLKQVEDRHKSTLAQVEATHKSTLEQAEATHKQSLELIGTVDLDLRGHRIVVYKTLWEKTKLLPMWPKKEGVKYADLQSLSEGLRDWYYEEGGIFLSRTTHKKYYSKLQEKIQEVLKGKNHQDVLTADDYEAVRLACSALRTALTDDVVSRRDWAHAESGRSNQALQQTGAAPLVSASS